MNFNEALDQLKAGEELRREAWPFDDGYLQLMKGMKYVWKIMLVPNPNAGNFIFSSEDFLANDWVKFELPSEPIEASVDLECGEHA